MLLAVTLATLAIFGALVAGITWRLRDQLRHEVLRREAEAIHAVALMQLETAGTPLAEFGPEFLIDDIFAAVLRSSKLRGVFAVQVFDARGALRHAQPIAPDDAAATRWWPDVPRTAQARFVRAGRLEMVSPELAVKTRALQRLPLLDIAVPVHSEGTAGTAVAVARYWTDGAPVAAEFARIDRRLATQGVAAFLGAAVLVGAVLALAFTRLAEANRRLREQSADLARANDELDFAAKTGALGAISAHLIHGLKNPLAGIEGFVAETVTGGADATHGEAARTAMETTRRLRALVNEVTTVLGDEKNGGGDYAVPVSEVVEAARQRAVGAAEQAGIDVRAAAGAQVNVSARTANLVGLVLANLVTNAIEAAPPDSTISIEAHPVDGRVEFLVRDMGPGLPPAVRAELFRPVRSTKRGGGGVGLAISHRLARHASGDLQLVRSDATGTVFCLRVPSV